jgi:hypothetical protein
MPSMFAPKTVSRCGLYAVRARTRLASKGRIKCGFMAVSLFISTRIQYVPVGMLNWGARYGWSSTREASKGTEGTKSPTDKNERAVQKPLILHS